MKVKGMKRQFKIGNRIIDENHPVYIIAELSANHNQDFDQAVQLIRAAKDAGADAIKLQTYTPDTITIDCNNHFFQFFKYLLERFVFILKSHRKPTL